jgi:hypothetical protein
VGLILLIIVIRTATGQPLLRRAEAADFARYSFTSVEAALVARRIVTQ